MYTIDDEKFNEYNESYNEEPENNNSFWDRFGSLIIKIIIIVVCLIVLIWLIVALKKNNNDDQEVAFDPNIHTNNVLKVRDAAYSYFFIDKHLPVGSEIKTVSVKEFIEKGKLTTITDANNKVCDDNKSTASLRPYADSYIMNIKLQCSTNEKEEVFFYNKDYHCTNCSDQSSEEVTPHEESEEEEEDKYSQYSCSTWSDWTDEKINDSMLTMRTTTFVKGVKEGKTKKVETYGEWSEYTTTPIEASRDLDVEQTVKTEKVWGETKTTTSYLSSSDTIKIVGKGYYPGSSYTYCPSGYTKEGNMCVGNNKLTGNLNYKEYNTYKIYNRPCAKVSTKKNSAGKYELIHESCQYSVVTTPKVAYSQGYTLYSYQELEEVNTTYYRSRTKTITEEKEKDIITDEYYEEDKLPKGYKKLTNSEKTMYSYKLSACEK